MGKKSYTVSIMGNELTVVSEDGEEHVKKVVEYVNGKIEGAGGHSGSVSTHSLALLTALNIADEFLKYKEETGEYIQRVLKSLEDVK